MDDYNVNLSYEELERLYNWYVSLANQRMNEIEDDELAKKINDILEEDEI